MDKNSEKNTDWSQVELESVSNCPACGDRANEKYHYTDLQDYLENINGKWGMRECAKCGSLYLDPRPKFEYIGKAYHSYHTHISGKAVHQKDAGSSLLWRLANGYLNNRYGTSRQPASTAGKTVIPLLPPIRQQLDFFYRHIPKTRGKLLDVGCGNGTFLLRAKDAGWDAIGLEPDPRAASAAAESGVSVINASLETFHSETTFDYITASHVIEHVHNPLLFLEKIYDSLSPGGTLWIATPNVRSIGHKVFGSSWRGLEPPRHITIFSASAIFSLLCATGFDCIKFHRRGRGSSYILRASQEIAQKQHKKNLSPPAFLIDIAASLITTASEELVVTARKRK